MSHLRPQGCWPALLVFIGPGAVAPAVGPLVGAIAATAVRVGAPLSAVPFRPCGPMVGIRGQPPCRRVSASGISMVARSFQPALRGT